MSHNYDGPLYAPWSKVVAGRMKPVKSFEEQRKNRLADSIDEYLNEGDCDVDQFYKDLRDCITDLRDYHTERSNKAQEALDAVLGHRPIPELDQNPEFPQGNRL